MTSARLRRFGRVLWAAAPHVLRSMRWPAVPLSWVVAAVFLARTRVEPTVDVIVVSMVVAGGLSFVIADPAAVTVASSPISRCDRVALRLVLTAPPAVLAWFLLLRVGSGAAGRLLPDSDAWLLFATFTVFAIAAEFWAGSTSTAAGLVGVPSLLAAQVVALQLPGRLAVYPLPDHRWRWVILLALATAACASALRDPASQRGATTLGRRRPAHR